MSIFLFIVAAHLNAFCRTCTNHACEFCESEPIT